MRASTVDHARIRRWVEAHGGHPAVAAGSTQGGTPTLRIDFPGYTDEEFLEPVSWETFFARLEAERLAFVYDVDDQSEPPFFQLVPRAAAGDQTDAEA